MQKDWKIRHWISLCVPRMLLSFPTLLPGPHEQCRPPIVHRYCQGHFSLFPIHSKASRIRMARELISLKVLAPTPISCHRLIGSLTMDGMTLHSKVLSFGVRCGLSLAKSAPKLYTPMRSLNSSVISLPKK